MRQPIKLIVKKGTVRKDGTSLIFIQYCYLPIRRVLVSTNISIPEIYWNKGICTICQSLPVKFGIPDTLEAQLREQLRNAEKLVDYALQNAIANLNSLASSQIGLKFDCFLLDTFIILSRIALRIVDYFSIFGIHLNSEKDTMPPGPNRIFISRMLTENPRYVKERF